MEIVGRGFIAGNLTAIADRHPTATVLAAGVSSTHVDTGKEFQRELDLVCETAKRCARDGRSVVFLSTASHAMYGPTETPASEDSAMRPESPYGRHKLDLEHAVADSGARWLILRLSHVVGRAQRPHQLLPAIVRQVRTGLVRVYRGAHRDLVDVADVVRAIDGLLVQGAFGEVVNVASGVPHPVETIVREIERRMDLVPQHELVDAVPALTRVSIEKLFALLPPMRSMTDVTYLDRILDRYVPSY
ncbi:nucleoside-diphosphate-sugar epimerase [Kibdelosporangium banguiense]|uniref:Nucleoside-diphosphate-sugar epimerase n=1 Tax=Kibdelosporangium banguiense TaxID=1365924 RepID=A0ABS4TYS8_9PSEU|nr:NAD-dependent epimerase/dehydratase family protein [Kibdelosporangium banguiense]MBP2329153.1 nucleoside-diphosphate-sugar epimerase [Kibdelosporangium banguiense]